MTRPARSPDFARLILREGASSISAHTDFALSFVNADKMASAAGAVSASALAEKRNSCIGNGRLREAVPEPKDRDGGQ
jgi:hypothetical protein